MTPWQSDVIAGVQLVFAVALWPTLANRQAQVPRRTSVTTAAGLWVIAAVYVSLALWSAVAMAAVSASAWTFVAIARPLRPARGTGGPAGPTPRATSSLVPVTRTKP